jgi:hypothetical protein
MENVYTMENWAVVLRSPENIWAPAPELGVPCLNGMIYGRSRFANGEPVLPGEPSTTSPVVAWDVENEAVVTKSGSRYRLGKVADAYETQYPNAKERFVGSLPQVKEGK